MKRDARTALNFCALLFSMIALVASMAPRVSATSFLYPVTQPVKLYTDINGTPLNNGYIYFGTAGQNPEVNAVQMYWDSAGTIPAAQPLRTMNGYIVRGGTPANVYASGDFSITVRNSNRALVFTNPNSVDLQLALAITGVGTAAAIPIADAGGYFTTKNVEAAFQQIASTVTGFVTLARLGSDVTPLLVPTGAVLDYGGTTAPTGWVLLSGRTIGSASSGGTERANADTSAVYTILWNSSANTELIIQDSAGTPTTRGASAANDFAANKRLPLPDCRGRVRAGKDNMGGSTAGRLTAATLLGTTQFNANGNTETQTLTIANLAAHNHTINITDPQHLHANTLSDPQHGHTVDTVAWTGSLGSIGSGVGAVSSVNLTGTSGAPAPVKLALTGVTINNASASTGITAASVNAGSGTGHANVQPTIIFTAIIKL